MRKREVSRIADYLAKLDEKNVDFEYSFVNSETRVFVITALMNSDLSDIFKMTLLQLFLRGNMTVCEVLRDVLETKL